MVRGRDLTLAFVRERPGEAARVLEHLPPAEAAALLADLPARVGAPLVARLFPAFAARCLEALADERAGTLLRRIGAPAAAAALRHVGEPRRAVLLAELPTAMSVACRLLLRYPADSVGALADVEVLAFTPETSVREALQRLRASGNEAGDFVYLVDANRRLRGCLRPAALLHAGSSLSLGELPRVDLPLLPAKATAPSVRDHDGWTSHSTLPVVDRERSFVGALRQAALAQALARRRAPPPRLPGGALELLAGAAWGAFDALLQAAVALLPGRSRGAPP